MKNTIFFCSVLFLFSCQCKQKPADQSSTNDTTQQIVISDSLQTIETLYVTAFDGLTMKSAPFATASQIGQMSFGDKVEVVDTNGEWLTIKYSVVQKDKGNKTTVYKKEKAYVLKKQTGTLASIQIQEKDLKQVSSIKTSKLDKKDAKGFMLNEGIDLKLIDEKTFLSNKSKSKTMLVDDAKTMPKKNGITELATSKGKKKYIDRPEKGDNSVVYSYVGQYASINQYVLEATYYENRNFLMLSKNTGKEQGPFSNIPLLSPNQKYIACVAENVYDATSNFELYSINGSLITPILKASFMNWFPVNEGANEFFWGVDNNMYIKVMHPKICSIEEGQKSCKYQYLRIEIANIKAP